MGPADIGVWEITMRKTTLAFAGALCCALAAGGASAQQFQAKADVNDGFGEASAYYGYGASGSSLGAVFDGGRDAFDTYGKITGDLTGLAFSRQTELFSDQNLFRFFDTFTNTTGSAITTTLTFGGNLGSDGGTQVLTSGGGLFVTCQGAGMNCLGDPIIAHVAGSAGLQSLAFDNYASVFNVTVGAGQSISLLNFAFLASSQTGTNASDIALATSKGQQLLANPYLAGLSAQQQAQIVNFTGGPPTPPGGGDGAGAVPEPATWALMILGFGGAGQALRLKRRRMALA